MQTSAKTKAILMMSIGNRPWVHVCAETFKLYAACCDADFCLETNLPTREDFNFPALPDTPGRKFKIAIASKVYFVWKYLYELGYQQLIVVDDTCCVRPTAVNLFDVISVGSCGGKKTSHLHAEDSFNYIRNFIQDNDLDHLDYDCADYVNGGFIVYDKSMTYAFQPENIIAASPLLYATYPHQTLTYYLLKRAQIPVVKLPRGFNILPGLGLDKAERRKLRDISMHIKDDVHVYHLTNSYKKRELLLDQLGRIFLKEWKYYA